MFCIFKSLQASFTFTKSMASVLGTVALVGAITSSSVSEAQGEVAGKRVDERFQTLRLGRDVEAYPFRVYANADLYQPLKHIERAVVILHGVQRDADRYFETGRKLLDKAGLSDDQTLLLAPNFLTPTDPDVADDMPLWPRDKWMHGLESQSGRTGIPGFQVLDDLVAYLSDRQRFPALKEIVMVSHSAGAQLMQRYAVVNHLDAGLKSSGLHIRYIIASPSSYLYFDDNRLQVGGFSPVTTVICPSYGRYRYGLEGAPAYVQTQQLSPQQLFARYAARDVTYLVGAKDNNPNSRVMDSSCGANFQGQTRVERQLVYIAYERFLGKKWQTPVNHPQHLIRGLGHSAAQMFSDEQVARIIFP
ncbi:hypothetical protein J2Y86_001166 [Pseudomonas migulae]|uniref:hypothetical protein n=1 Tax=Pseudomonas migulae TaxID=78543 RepID=UPI0020A0B4D2|nr:hypothetical protein [Pseudomonas migulae]MCP1496459.1 hypothetical protein [Pseudomonas migulae]